MTRIWEPRAYGNAPLANCWWAETVPPRAWPALPGDRHADVAIIGGGFTGLSAALHLAEAGADVILLEAHEPYWGASGRNGGFCCLGGGKASGATLDARHGPGAAAAWRDTEKAAIGLVADLLARHTIDADRHSEGETLLAHSPARWNAIRRDAEAAARDYGVTPRLIPAADLPAHGLRGPFHGAMTLPCGFALNPRKYADGLARAARGAGARIFARSPVTAIRGTGPWRLVTPGGGVTADRVIVATNGYSSDDLPPWMRARYLPTQSAVLVTRPLTRAEQEAQGWTSQQMCYDSRNLLHYFRLMPDGRFLFGARGGLRATARASRANHARLRADFKAMFPAWAHVETPWHWSGLVCLTRGLMPYVGPVAGMPGVFAGFGFHGNGVAMGSHAGAVLADLALDRAPERLWPDALRALPRRFPLGRFRRALMQPAYAAYALKDRL